MALSMGAVEHEEMVPRPDAAAVHHLGQAANPARRSLRLLRLLPLRLGWLLLARRHPNALLSPHAVFREQPSSSEARIAGRRRFQPEHLVARSVAGDSVGRKLAW